MTLGASPSSGKQRSIRFRKACLELTTLVGLAHVSSVNRRAVTSSGRQLLGLLTLAVGLGTSSAASAGPQVPPLRGPSMPKRDLGPLNSTSWLVGEGQSYRLPTWSEAPLLQRFVNPAVERRHPADEYWHGRFGQRAIKSDLHLVWLDGQQEPRQQLDLYFPSILPTESEARSDDLPAWLDDPQAPPALDSLADQLNARWRGPQLLPTWALQAPPAPLEPFSFAPLRKPCAPWEPTPREVTVGRYGAETDRFLLLECDGSVAPEALDRLSVMARPPGVDRPELPLPVEPDAEAVKHDEWLKGVKLLHPRVLWLLNKLALAYPGHPIYLISGYRRDAHSSYHRKGRALDLFMSGVPNEDLFKYCHKLRDVGCGYYPHHNFVHVDVRPFGSGHPFWVDVSGPGEPSRYVDGWPGVIESGGLSWAGGE
ncbi:MAG: D-Ala-D-Ala carboxypeptidase family metallohydrolase [Polyangiaceae bacterium]